jgi:hypothetical protein
MSENEGREEISRDESEDQYFNQTGGLHVEADLRSVFGTSPMSVAVDGESVRIAFGVSGGEVAGVMKPEAAEKFAAAVESAAADARER